MKILEYFKNSSGLVRKVVGIYLLLSVVPILLITGIANIIYTNIFIEQSQNLVEQNSKQHEIIIKERMQQYENVLYELVTDRDYLQLAQNVDSDDRRNQLVWEYQMETQMRSLVYTYDAIRGVVFLADNDRYVSYSRWYLGNQEVVWANLQDRKKIHDEVEKKEGLTFIAMVDLSNQEPNDYVVLMGFPVRDLRTKKQSGVLVLALKAEVLLFENNPIDENGVTTVITDECQRIMAGVDTSYTNHELQVYLDHNYENTEYTIQSYPVEDMQWSIVNIVDMAEQRREIHRFTAIVFCMMIGITVLFFVIVYHISQRYINEIQRIVQGLEGFDGTDPDSLEIQLEDKDELYVIAVKFNQMTRRVKRLVEALEQRTEEVRIAAINQKHAEIKALEAQINPHFLFNSLNAGAQLAMMEDAEKTSIFIEKMADFFRYNVRKMEEATTLGEELEAVDNYVYILNVRFAGDIHFETQIAEDVEDVQLPSMILQPVVENAVNHGIRGVDWEGHIWLSVERRAHGLEIRVRDNGEGMTQERIREVLEGTLSPSGNGRDSTGIGLDNVITRLELFFGQKGLLQIYSEGPGKGTEVCMTIPVETVIARDGQVHEV